MDADSIIKSGSPTDTDELLQAELVPVSRIGVETELSRYPIHSLSKRGGVQIHIIKRADSGEVDVRWEVTYNSKYGPPRQIAYKLDTLVINRRIDQEGRPLPKIMKIGSLREIAEQLDLGGDTNSVRRALRQNAFAAITAKLKYRSIDGTERSLEADFTRYSVIFTGEKLPSGRTADAVYIVLNDIFRDVLNNAPVRPLNYEYLKALPPAPQRFYEIISSRIYGAQKTKRPFARITYSEFCTYSALTRHFDHENFRVQMAKILRLHIKSGYISKVHHTATVDGDGNIDWMMCFTPGPRARAEYMTFTRKNKELALRIEQDAAQETAEAQAAEATDELLAELLKRGVAPTRARSILAELSEAQQVLNQLEWGDYLIQTQPQHFKNPAGFYVYLVTNNVAPPASFESGRQHLLRENAEQSAQVEFLEQQQIEEEFGEYCRAETDRYIRENLSATRIQEIQQAKRKQLASQIASFDLMSQENIERLLWSALRAEVRPKVPVLTLEQFRERSLRQPNWFRKQEATPVPRISEEALRTRYADYRRQQAQAAISALDQAERGRRLKQIRFHLLTEHPDREQYQQLMATESYEEFSRISEQQLLENTLKHLALPAFEDWKKTVGVPMRAPAERTL